MVNSQELIGIYCHSAVFNVSLESDISHAGHPLWFLPQEIIVSKFQ
jgi:hypothetical protein